MAKQPTRGPNRFADLRISVVIPLHNRQSLIPRCIDSVLKQTYEPFEVIVVDDGSTDNSREQVLQYEDRRVKLVEQEARSGAQGARNRGIHEAGGEWIAFLDADDEWYPGKLERQTEVLQCVEFDPMTVVHCDCDVATEGRQHGERWSLPVVDGATAYRSVLMRPGPMFPGILTSHLALEKIGFLDENVVAYQEWDTAIRLARLCRVAHIREPLFVYYLHDLEAISRDKLRAIQGYRYVVEKHESEIVAQCGTAVFNRHVVNNARRALAEGDFDQAADILKKHKGLTARLVLLTLLQALKIRAPRGRLADYVKGMPRWILGGTTDERGRR